jgi:hypothetical protein
MSLFRNENPILGPLTQITWADGSIHNLAGDNQSQFQGTALTNVRAIDSEPAIAASSVAVTGSIAAIRGNLTTPVGSTISSGFAYGVQGKLTAKGTLSSANFSAGLVGQLDLSVATALGSGQIAAIWGDMGATLSAGAISGQAVLNLMLLTNTAPGSMINSVFHVEALATYLFDVSNASYSPFFTGTAPTTLSGSLKVNTSAGVRYIALYSAAS